VRIKVTAKLPAFDLTDEAKTALAELLCDVLEEQARAGIGGDGSALVSSSGQPLDLRDRGELWGDVSFGPLSLRLRAEHASYVLERYSAGKLSPAYQKIFEERAAPIIKKGLIAKVK
jgi:hypothetical protein